MCDKNYHYYLINVMSCKARAKFIGTRINNQNAVVLMDYLVQSLREIDELQVSLSLPQICPSRSLRPQ